MRPAFIHFLLSVVIALIALGVYAFWFMKLTDARTEAKESQAAVIAIEHEDAAIAAAEGALAALSADEAAVEGYVLSQDHIVGFLEELEHSGDRLNSSVEVVSVSPGAEGGDGRLTVSLRIEGSFASVMRTLGSIEYAQRDIRLSSLTLDTASSDAGAVWGAAASFSVATQPTP